MLTGTALRPFDEIVLFIAAILSHPGLLCPVCPPRRDGGRRFLFSDQRLFVLGEELVVDLLEGDMVEDAVADDGVPLAPDIELGAARLPEELLRLIQTGLQPGPPASTSPPSCRRAWKAPRPSSGKVCRDAPIRKRGTAHQGGPPFVLLR